MLKQIASKIYEKARLLYGVTYNKEYALSDEMLTQLYNVHLGERCFIIGTGPSLNKTDFTPIKDEILFGVNKLYLDTPRFGISPQYWCVADAPLFDYTHFDLLKLETVLFLTAGAGQLFLNHKLAFIGEDTNEPIIVRPKSDMKTSMEFSKNALQGVNGGMVTLSCLQLAYHMGFREVYLIGCDCTSKGSHSYGAKDSNVTGNDDWSTLFKTYEVCKRVYEEDGRKIYNATVGGALEVFERVRLEDLK